MAETKLPPCGIYRTIRPIGEVPASRLVYYHNHGEPGGGIYLPAGWRGNRARFQERGTTLANEDAVNALEPLAPEGFYRVIEAFYCCERRCRMFEIDSLVQLGYDGEGNALLFVPEIVNGLLAVPELGSRIDMLRIARLQTLKVPVADAKPDEEGPH